MSPRTWAEAKTAKSVETARDEVLGACVDQGCTVRGWPPVAPQRALVEADARALSYESGLRAQLAMTASPDTCEDAGESWVDAAVGWFDLDNGFGGKGRIPATKAVWLVPLVVTASAAPLVVDASTVVQLQALDGTIFEAAQQVPVTLNAAGSYRATVRFVARKAGTSGNVLPGQIVKVISGAAGLSVDLLGTQVLDTSARDQETSSAYISRARGRWGTLGAGWTAPAFDYLIPTKAPTVTRWAVRDDNPLGPGTTKVVIANAAGPATSGEVAAVQAALGARSVKSLGSSTLSVVGATAHAFAISATLESDGSVPLVGTLAWAALVTLTRVFPLGIATLTRDLVREVLMGAPLVRATIPLASGGSKVIALGLPGFGSVRRITSLSMTSDELVGDGEVLVATPTVTVA